ncbi:hypothetical protein E1B28_003445 [Marasmius oreades]|uniref:Uncharacterized protein n=1 Tax=Marasmius oreades TaxID=181124 RepID=A0A9P7RMJ1_9AGAR|nr:uncharacterized protein E1B28_003445 [Marasmius oreades]KAG7085911.1 hypothetical protein E1B28_003445 [Marasmius oreades]
MPKIQTQKSIRRARIRAFNTHLQRGPYPPFPVNQHAQNPPVIGDPVLPLRLIHLFLNMHLNDDTLLRIAMVAFCLGFLASYLQMHRRFSGL